jgi:penicillin-binding protein 1A
LVSQEHRALLKKLIAAALALVFVGAAGLVGTFIYFSSTVPDIRSLADYRPKQSTHLYSDDGYLVGEFFRERRRVVAVNDLPKHVVRVFVAAEDANFFTHEGLDYWGIVRAGLKNLRPGAHLQGASTITQQTVKTLVVGPDRTYARKIREVILSRELESFLSKEEILHLYLNQIYFGSGAYGIEEASRIYFNKSARKLNLGEAAYLAACPKNPGRYNIRSNPKSAKQRQIYVLQRMQEQGWSSPEDTQSAIAAPIPAPQRRKSYVGGAAHYVEFVRRSLAHKLGEETLLEGGLTIYLGLRAAHQDAGHKALRQGLEDLGRRHGYPGAKQRVEVDQYRAFMDALDRKIGKLIEIQKLYDPQKNVTSWISHLEPMDELALQSAQSFSQRGRLAEFELDGHYTGVIREVDSAGRHAWLDLGTMWGRIDQDTLTWARPFSPLSKTQAPRNMSQVFRQGDIVSVQVLGEPEGVRRGKPVTEVTLVSRPQAEGALVSIDPFSRHVTSLVGGYETFASGLIRATQAKRQPGSAFKPILYATAIAQKAITPASICADSPVSIPDPWTGKTWKPTNYDGSYDGNITFRQALTRSKNTCSVKLIDKIGYESVVDLARQMGISSDLPPNLTLALGTGDISPLELANAYSTIAAGGMYSDVIFVRKVVDSSGAILLEKRAELSVVLDPGAAYVVTDMMRSVVEEGTATKAQVLKRDVVGKTGTSQDSRNVWFSGYSPEVVATVWVGFDNNKSMGRVYGGTVALPIWIRFMGRVLAGTEPIEFTQPQGVSRAWIDAGTGKISEPEHPLAIHEVFVEGTEPKIEREDLESPFLIDD